MPFIISFSLSLLVVVAGLFLLIKSHGIARIYKILAWIIIGLGIVITLMSIQMAIFRCCGHMKNRCHEKEKCMMFNQKCQEPSCFRGCEDEENCGFAAKGCGKKMMFYKNFDDDDEGGVVQTEAIVKVIGDSLKITPEQEKKIKAAVESALKDMK